MVQSISLSKNEDDEIEKEPEEPEEPEESKEKEKQKERKRSPSPEVDFLDLNFKTPPLRPRPEVMSPWTPSPVNFIWKNAPKEIKKYFYPDQPIKPN